MDVLAKSTTLRLEGLSIALPEAELVKCPPLEIGRSVAWFESVYHPTRGMIKKLCVGMENRLHMIQQYIQRLVICPNLLMGSVSVIALKKYP